MRLLVVSNMYPPAAEGGYEMICADLMARFSTRHRISVISSKFGRERVPPEPDVRRVLDYQVRKLDTFLAPIAAWQGARAMRAALAESRPELIFVWNAAAVPHSALWVAQQTGIPIAFYIAAPWLDGLYSRDRFARHLCGNPEHGLRHAWGSLMRLVNHAPGLRIKPGTPFEASVCWVSEATRTESPAPPFVELIQHRVINPATRRYERFAAAARNPGDGPPVIAFVGRLEQQKGPDVALRAIAQLQSEGIDVRFEVAGRGDPDYVQSLERQADELGIADRVRWRGALDLDGVIELFSRAHLFLLPSSWQEPMATVSLEAAFARIPVVASLSGGMPEALRPGREALYFPIGDWQRCANAIAAALADPQETEARTARARERADQFTFERFAKQMTEFVERAVAGRSAAADTLAR
jgi:glycosyltransferase involved in cell wall biosynthesis